MVNLEILDKKIRNLKTTGAERARKFCSLTMAGKGSKKSSVLIKWKTEDQWRDTQQRITRKNIKPADGALKKDQSVSVKFNRSWYPAEICEEWTGEKEQRSKWNSVQC